MRRHLPLLIVILLGGCAGIRPVAPVDTRPESPVEATTRRQEAPKPSYNLTGYPPAVRDGYIDGCETAKGSSFGRKDARRMGEDPQYAMGWNDGHSICMKK